jgi:hypothetical protein
MPLLALLIFVVGIGAFFGFRWLRLQAAIADQGEIPTVLDTFISRLEAKDVEGVIQLQSRSAVGLGAIQVAESRISKSHLYENYKSLVLDEVRVTSHRGFIHAYVSGTVEYTNGTRRKLTSTLDRDGDTWLVAGLKIEEPAAEKDAADE